MLTLEVLESVKLSARPLGQAFFSRVLDFNYRFPFTQTPIAIEGEENLPFDRPVYLAMNHTDRFNYLPFQVELYKRYDRFAATWVKGKYFNNPVVRQFLTSTSNIPTPSKGYLITSDAVETLGAPPRDDLYRLLRDAVDEQLSDEDLLTRAEAFRLQDAVGVLVETDRDMLGRSYRSGDGWATSQLELFQSMMEHFLDLNMQAFELGLYVLVFPEGTRSRRLTVGRTGLAQMALRTGHPIVPIGCNGTDAVYPGDVPVASGGDVIYRIGKPIEHDAELAEFQITDDYTPFTESAEAHADAFRGATDVVMARINELLDPQYRREAGKGTAVEGIKRFH
jgi:1-acyl-sn-glycerol-3-phosphate acyltransferase